MILFQGHAVTLTFKVVNQILRVHIVHIATYACTKFMRLALIVFKLSKDPDFSRTDWQTDWRTDGQTDGRSVNL